MVLLQPYLSRVLRRLHQYTYSDPIEDEWRGWRWDQPPLRPRAYFGLSMGDVVYRYCSTRRIVWLRHVKGVKQPPGLHRQLQIGSIVHKVFHIANRTFLEASVHYSDPCEVFDYMNKKGLEYFRDEGIDLVDEQWSWNLYRRLAHSYVGAMSLRTIWHPGSRGYEGMIWITEHHVDGSMLGLSQNLRVDAFGEGVVVEIKYGKPMDFHRLALAGYALALEANYEVPVNYGIIIYVNGVPEAQPRISAKPYYLSTSLRKFFIDERDEVIDLLLSEREPPKPLNCPESCPFYSVCNGGV